MSEAALPEAAEAAVAEVAVAVAVAAVRGCLYKFVAADRRSRSGYCYLAVDR